MKLETVILSDLLMVSGLPWFRYRLSAFIVQYPELVFPVQALVR